VTEQTVRAQPGHGALKLWGEEDLATMIVGYDALPSLVTVEVAQPSSAPPDAATMLDRTVTVVRDGELRLSEVVPGYVQSLDLRLDPGEYRLVIKVTGREESRQVGMDWDAECARLMDAGEPESTCPPEPEPVEHWWVSFLSEPPVS